MPANLRAARTSVERQRRVEFHIAGSPFRTRFSHRPPIGFSRSLSVSNSCKAARGLMAAPRRRPPTIDDQRLASQKIKVRTALISSPVIGK